MFQLHCAVGVSPIPVSTGSLNGFQCRAWLPPFGFAVLSHFHIRQLLIQNLAIDQFLGSFLQFQSYFMTPGESVPRDQGGSRDTMRAERNERQVTHGTRFVCTRQILASGSEIGRWRAPAGVK